MSAAQRKAPSKAVQLAIDAGAPTIIDPSTLPDVTDISPETVMEMRHLHDYARETKLTTEEWITAIQFLTAMGQKCSPIRHEFILLSDVLGVSALVDSINHTRQPNATENTVLVDQQGPMASEGKGDPLLVTLRVLDTQGRPVPGARVEMWETDAEGFYDTQYEGRTGPDCRGRLNTQEDGVCEFWAVFPVAYPIPSDGPVGSLLRSLHTSWPSTPPMFLPAGDDPISQQQSSSTYQTTHHSSNSSVAASYSNSYAGNPYVPALGVYQEHLIAPIHPLEFGQAPQQQSPHSQSLHGLTPYQSYQSYQPGPSTAGPPSIWQSSQVPSTSRQTFPSLNTNPPYHPYSPYAHHPLGFSEAQRPQWDQNVNAFMGNPTTHTPSSGSCVACGTQTGDTGRCQNGNLHYVHRGGCLSHMEKACPVANLCEAAAIPETQ
ncbi:aromatic compound dioxygenase [Dacryopinax primogenitus]|uniref:Aromatic compound dioxygenase n=1 Tax=Dacryopinax primogenitus (strain DJM 731) TaxID=1858805 RepID=M5G8W0_DACPD|nr:aromatic compound dioxygenase [Dacryopinax primogenitus]EJU00188.1 aromatic compound dioxygenase [Dacryopinax primogenitus]